jgi:hypothetical protein
MEREPPVITRGSAFTDGVRVNIRKAHKTMTILGIEISFKHYGFNGWEQGFSTVGEQGLPNNTKPERRLST